MKYNNNEKNAGIIQWQNVSFPSLICGFDSRYLLQNARLWRFFFQSRVQHINSISWQTAGSRRRKYKMKKQGICTTNYTKGKFCIIQGSKLAGICLFQVFFERQTLLAVYIAFIIPYHSNFVSCGALLYIGAIDRIIC